MNLSTLYEERNTNATRDVNASISGRGANRGRTKANQGRGGHNMKRSTRKPITILTQGLLRLRGGAPVEMDLSDDQDGDNAAPPN
jgi:hypothetical protein